MLCPHCNQDIDDRDIARHLAAKGGGSRSEAKIAACRLNASIGGRRKAELRRKAEKEAKESMLEPFP
jgi:hypothetical protein